MPPKRNHHRKNNKPPIVSAGPGADAMANCILPKDVVVSILTRLPVKSIHRFKFVCKPWYKLFATPRFMKMHHAQLSQTPENQSVVIYSRDAKHDHILSLFKIGSPGNVPVNLEHPFPQILLNMDFVGSCYGLLCLSFPPRGQMIFVLNPVSKFFKCLPLPVLDVEESKMSSLGFGYDSGGDDFKVVRIVHLQKKKKKKNTAMKKMGVGAEVYSSNSNSWKTVNVDFQFSVLKTKSDVNVNGNPYWVAKIDESGSLVWFEFDVRKMVFKIVPLSGLDFKPGDKIHALVDWKGSLATLVCNKNGERVLSLDVWVFDDGRKTWRKNHTFGPIELKLGRFLQCSKNGKFFGECYDGELFMFDSENGGVKEIAIDGARKGSFEIYEYTESVACIEGMAREKVSTEEEIRKREKLIDDLVDSFVNTYLNRGGDQAVG